MDKASVQDVIHFFSNVFTVVMALALTESFKQFIADRATEPEHRVVHWERLYALVSFLVLLFPFFQGMNRYFSVTYGDLSHLPQPYSSSLMFDGVAFTCESALFFVMSRALAPAQWGRFYTTVLLLLVVDSFWGGVVTVVHDTPVEAWIILNIGFACGVFLLLWWHRSKTITLYAARLAMAMVIIRTLLDYYYSWNFYLPT
jgi:hypothetical protein